MGTRKPSPFNVGDRVRQIARPVGQMVEQRGTVIAVRDEWPTVGNGAFQAIEIRYDRNVFSPDSIGYASGWGAIRPWCWFKPEIAS